MMAKPLSLVPLAVYGIDNVCYGDGDDDDDDASVRSTRNECGVKHRAREQRGGQPIRGHRSARRQAKKSEQTNKQITNKQTNEQQTTGVGTNATGDHGHHDCWPHTQ